MSHVTSRTPHRSCHLRLTATILAALLAAIAVGVLDESARGRRGDSGVAFSALRSVWSGDELGHESRLAQASARPAARLVPVDAPLAASGGPLARAALRVRLDGSRATGAALLRTTALPPPAC
jgi:hypothetical protein